MMTVLDFLDQVVPLLWRATWQAAVLIVLVVVVRTILGRRLSPGWRAALWGLVLVRLVVPVIPAGPLSLFRLTASLDTPWWQPTADRSAWQPEAVDEHVAPARDRDQVQDHATPSPPGVDPGVLSVRSLVSAAQTGLPTLDDTFLARFPLPVSPADIAGLAWLAGVLFLSVRMAGAAVRLGRQIRTQSFADNASQLAQFEACRRTMGVRRTVRLRATARDLGPAVTGLWRPCILIPRAVLDTASQAELEHILLHELAHVRRWDVAVNWLWTTAAVLHWFNPAVWFAAARIRADCELACDAAVLQRLGRARRAAYGNTVLTLAAGLASEQSRTGLVGAFGAGRHLQERIIMIARYTPIARGWGWLAALVLVALAVTGLTDAADPSPTTAMAIAMAGQAEGREPGQSGKPVPKPIADAIAVLRATEVRRPDRSGPAMRSLAEIGRPAVPYLIDELDRTKDGLTLCSLAFSLRAIGDPRAVPALIRAIPRTLVESAGDNGVFVADRKLYAFLRQHDLDLPDDGRTVAFGTPYHEVLGTLHVLTGHRFSLEEEMHFIDLQGSPAQLWLRRGLFHELAALWAVWWKQNWRRFTDDAAFSKVSVAPMPNPPRVAEVPADQPFPLGNRIRTASSAANISVGPPPPHPQPDEYYRTFKDLDTGRESPWPASLPAESRVKEDEVAAFAKRQGFDLRGTEFTAPGSGRRYYVLQGLGLRAWQIDNARFHSIEQELRAGKAPKLDRPAGDLLIHVDPKTGVGQPETKATFLFVTREGSTGVLQLNGQVTGLHQAGDAPGFLRPEPPEEPGKPAQLPLVHGAYRGIQFHYKFFYIEDDQAR
jgi:beta-lactamase regulating signal transducer with metallopeptidase domain